MNTSLNLCKALMAFIFLTLQAHAQKITVTEGEPFKLNADIIEVLSQKKDKTILLIQSGLQISVATFDTHTLKLLSQKEVHSKAGNAQEYKTHNYLKVLPLQSKAVFLLGENKTKGNKQILFAKVYDYQTNTVGAMIPVLEYEGETAWNFLQDYTTLAATDSSKWIAFKKQKKGGQIYQLSLFDENAKLISSSEASLSKSGELSLYSHTLFPNNDLVLLGRNSANANFEMITLNAEKPTTISSQKIEIPGYITEIQSIASKRKTLKLVGLYSKKDQSSLFSKPAAGFFSFNFNPVNKQIESLWVQPFGEEIKNKFDDQDGEVSDCHVKGLLEKEDGGLLFFLEQSFSVGSFTSTTVPDVRYKNILVASIDGSGKNKQTTLVEKHQLMHVDNWNIGHEATYSNGKTCILYNGSNKSLEKAGKVIPINPQNSQPILATIDEKGNLMQRVLSEVKANEEENMLICLFRAPFQNSAGSLLFCMNTFSRGKSIKLRLAKIKVD